MASTDEIPKWQKIATAVTGIILVGGFIYIKYTSGANAQKQSDADVEILTGIFRENQQLALAFKHAQNSETLKRALENIGMLN